MATPATSLPSSGSEAAKDRHLCVSRRSTLLLVADGPSPHADVLARHRVRRSSIDDRREKVARATGARQLLTLGWLVEWLAGSSACYLIDRRSISRLSQHDDQRCLGATGSAGGRHARPDGRDLQPPSGTGPTSEDRST
jgi:hypothetical protein